METLQNLTIGGKNMSFNSYRTNPNLTIGEDDTVDSTPGNHSINCLQAMDPSLLDSLTDNYSGKKKVKKKKGKGKKRKRRLEQTVARVNFQNGVLAYQNFCLDRMLHLALGAQKGTLREPPIEVGFEVLGRGRR